MKMLPYVHFLIAVNFIFIFAFFFQVDILTGILWALVGGLFSFFLDMDAFIGLIINRIVKKNDEDDGLKEFANPIKIITDYEVFMERFFASNLFKIIAATHFIIAIVAVWIVYSQWRPYFIAVAVGLGSHLLSDLFVFFKDRFSEHF